MATRPARMSLTKDALLMDPADVSGRPFRSVLKPHLEFIRAQRRADKSWQEIADELNRLHGVTITGRGVNRFFAAIRKRKTWPLGMEPQPTAAPLAAGPETTSPEPHGVLGGKRGRKGRPASEPDRHRSRLFPHLASIQTQRAAGDSWRQIAETLAARGIRISHQAVSDFFRRTCTREARRAAETAIPQPGNVTSNPKAPHAPASPRNPFPDEDDYMSQMNQP